MLEIAVHKNDRFAAGATQTRSQRGLMTEIAGERDIADGRIARRQTSDLRQSAVGRAIIDKNNFMGEAASGGPDQRIGYRAYIFRLIVTGQHKRNFGSDLVHSRADRWNKYAVLRNLCEEIDLLLLTALSAAVLSHFAAGN